MTVLRLTTPSRLHFGLLGWGPSARRQFGGVGLMVDDPGLAARAEPSSRWEATGVHAERALSIAAEVSARLAAEGHVVPPVRLTIEQAPAEHVGFGVGTQLSLAIARLLTAVAGFPEVPVATLARLTGRGRRSGIGIHGFAAGGLIIDGGRRTEEEIPIRLFQAPFPAAWSILLIVPEAPSPLHGPAELQAFRALPPVASTLTDRLCALVLLGLLPAVLETDLPTFGACLSEIQALVGESFAPIQQGAFADVETERRAGRLRAYGLHGVGQSSWGPTLYGFSDLEPSARAELRAALIQESGMRPEQVFWTQANTTGARLFRIQ